MPTWLCVKRTTGKTLVSGSHDGTVKVWNLAMGQERHPSRDMKIGSMPSR